MLRSLESSLLEASHLRYINPVMRVLTTAHHTVGMNRHGASTLFLFVGENFFLKDCDGLSIGRLLTTRSLGGWRLGDGSRGGGCSFGLDLVTSEILSRPSGFVISGRVGHGGDSWLT